MNTRILRYSPDGTDQPAGTGSPADEKLVEEQHDREWRGEEEPTGGNLTNLQLDPKSEGDDQTILGAGGLAGGLSGDGTYTDEYDAAVMGLGD
ncbi:MAG TPA: hypothetical protein VGA96_09955 [Fibrella sp.]